MQNTLVIGVAVRYTYNDYSDIDGIGNLVKVIKLLDILRLVSNYSALCFASALIVSYWFAVGFSRHAVFLWLE
jgi:hypothetical protein